MQKFLQIVLFVSLSLSMSAQTVILDFETPESSAEFGNFGPDGDPSLIIDNPNPTGINTSGKVLEYVDRAGSEIWAGMFGDLPTPVVASPGGKICVDAHFDHMGSVLLKLEMADNGGPDWETTQSNATMNEWEQMCWSFDELDGAGSGQNAVGASYSRLVLFVDFGEVPETDVITYFDNVVVEEGQLAPVDLTFSVDMSSYANSFTQVFLSGSFNDWSENANPLTDNGDGTWSTTLTGLPAGPIEWKFQVDEWTDDEKFRVTDQCVVVINNGEFINRSGSYFESTTIPTVCWASCYACGDANEITFNVAVPDPADSGVYIAGGAGFGAPGGVYGMSDDDGDGVFSLTIERPTSFESFFTIANGNCPDYSCKENISGQDCADPDNFNDRFLAAGTTEVNTCFGQCTDVAECATVPTTTTVFTVDMTGVTVNADGMRIAGEMTGWSEDVLMTDNGDGTFSATFELEKRAWEYKFKNGPDGWENLMAGDECTVTSPDGVFTNRVIDLTDTGDEFSTIAYCFEACAICITSVNDLEVDNSSLEVFPTLVQDHINIAVDRAFTDGQISIYSIDGGLISQFGINNSQVSVDAVDYASGLYIIDFRSNEFRATQKVVKD